MIHPFGVRMVPLCAVALATVVGACTMDIAEPKAPSAPTSFVGTYDLVSVSFSDDKPIAPPAVTGVLALTPSTYKITVHLTSPDSTATDSGTYSVSGNHWTQISAGFPLRSEGTASFTNDTLTVNVVTANVQVSNTWHKRTQTSK